MESLMPLPEVSKNDPYLTPYEIWKYIFKEKLSRTTVYLKVKTEMPHRRIGKRLFVKQSDFDAWDAKQVVEPYID